MLSQHEETQEQVVLRLLESGPKRATELLEEGASRTAIARLAAAGRIEGFAMGVYRLPGAEFDVRETWAAIAKRIPAAVICLSSAASFHGLTQDSAWRTSIAVPHTMAGGQRLPGAELDVSRWRSAEAFVVGVEEHEIAGIPVRVTSPARTIVDLFRMSTLNPSCRAAAAKVTPETFLDAMFRFLDPERGHDDVGELGRIADAFGVLDYIQPYVMTAQFAGAARMP